MIMKKINLLWHIFELEDRAANFLNSYLKRLDDYIFQNNVSDETSQDIKYSIIEKLYWKKSPILQQDVFQIASEIWEPEEIFSSNENFEQKNQIIIKNELASNKPLIWWVAYWISKSLNINIFVLRILFILASLLGVIWIVIWVPEFFLISTLSILVYIILAIFAPYRSKSLKSTLLSAIEIWLWIIRLIVLFWLLFIIWSLMIWGLIFLASKFYIIDNRSFSQFFPNWLFSIMFVWVATLWIFTLDLVCRFFNKRLFSTASLFGLLITSFLSYLVVALTLGKYVIWVRELDSKENFPLKIAQSSQDIWSIWDENINFSIIWNNWAFNNLNISFEPSSWENILVEKNYDVYTLEKFSQTIKDNLQDLNISKTWNKIILDLQWYKDYKNVVPLNLTNINIKFLVPKNKKIIFNDYNPYWKWIVWNVNLDFWHNYDRDKFFDCILPYQVSFKPDQNEFDCERQLSEQTQIAEKIQQKYNLWSLEIISIEDWEYRFEWTTNDWKFLSWVVDSDQLNSQPSSSNSSIFSSSVLVNSINSSIQDDQQVIENILN